MSSKKKTPLGWYLTTNPRALNGIKLKAECCRLPEGYPDYEYLFSAKGKGYVPGAIFDLILVDTEPAWSGLPPTASRTLPSLPKDHGLDVRSPLENVVAIRCARMPSVCAPGAVSETIYRVDVIDRLINSGVLNGSRLVATVDEAARIAASAHGLCRTDMGYACIRVEWRLADESGDMWGLQPGGVGLMRRTRLVQTNWKLPEFLIKGVEDV